MLEHLTALELREKITQRQLTCRQVVEWTLDRISRLDKPIGSYISVLPDYALRQADRIDAQIAAGQPVGALAGVPIAVKDNLCTDFAATTCGSKILEQFNPPYNAFIVQRLLGADAIVVGKTNMDEFAMGSSTENSGLKKTVNPWNYQHVPGGSSGGSAAAMAASLCAAAIGSDTGGSIRQPASFCGVTGLKPTYGRVSRYGLVAYGSSLDQIGPITKTVKDAALLMNVIAGHDPQDSTSVSTAAVLDYLNAIDKPIDSLKIAVVPALLEGAQPEVRTAVDEALRLYTQAGAKLVEVQLPHFDYSIAAYYVIATAEASSNLARFDGCHYGHRSSAAQDYIQVYSRSRAEGFGAEVKRRIMLGTFALSSGYYDAYYLKALKVRNLIRQDFVKVFEQADCLMMPVSPTTAFKVGEKTSDPLQMYLADIYTIGVNLAGVPALSIPCGFDNANLPIGLQIIASPFQEDKLLRIAEMFERQTDFHSRQPAL